MEERIVDFWYSYLASTDIWILDVIAAPLAQALGLLTVLVLFMMGLIVFLIGGELRDRWIAERSK